MYDYIIVGGGSAGCVLANRLSADPEKTVLLLESGDDLKPGTEPREVLDTFSPNALADPRYLWPNCMVNWQPGKPKRYEQGHVIGGGSSVNGMWAIRGLPGDYDQWDSLGAKGWKWSDVLPHFVRLERDGDFSGPQHGNTGLIPIRRHRRDEWPPMCKAVSEALEQRGYRFVADMNTQFDDGICAVPMNNTVEQRVSVAIAYLDSRTRSRSNLTVLPNTRVYQLLNEGRRIAGVKARSSSGDSLFQSRHTIVSGGAYQSPTLLLRSGIGPASELQEIGIRVIADVPGVGKNLHDHPYAYLVMHLRKSGMQSPELRPFANSVLRFSSGLEGCAESDMMITMLNKTMWHPLGQRLGALGVSIYKPLSRGEVTLRSSDEEAPPRIEYRLLSDERDMSRMKKGIRLTHSLLKDPRVARVRNEAFLAAYSDAVRKINLPRKSNYLKSAAFTAMLDGPAFLRRALIRAFITQGKDTEAIVADDRLLEQYLRDSTTAVFHPVGTCRMGDANDRMAVVDSLGNVIGVEGLSVVDASIMPAITRGNTNIPTIMIAEKVATERFGYRGN